MDTSLIDTTKITVMSEKSSVLIVSSSNTKASSIIKLIGKTSVLTTPENSAIVIHPLPIDTKYYTTEINLIAIDNAYQRTKNFNQKVEALIIHMDANKESGLDDLKVWKTIEQDCEPEIKLLISNYCNKDTKITIEMALGWCLEYGYEFIELYPLTNTEADDMIVEEKVGIERVIEALETHTWPNLVMKSKSKHEESLPANENEPQGIDNIGEEYFKWIDKSEDILTSEDLDDFSKLFSQLNMMRESLKDMPSSQKRVCAEQMATAFWKAIGGDEEEITNL